MIDGVELGERASMVAKMIDACPIDDIENMRLLLAMAEEIRLDFAEWMEENRDV